MDYKNLKLSESKHLMIIAWSLEFMFALSALLRHMLLLCWAPGERASVNLSSNNIDWIISFSAMAFVELLKIPTMKGICLLDHH